MPRTAPREIFSLAEVRGSCVCSGEMLLESFEGGCPRPRRAAPSLPSPRRDAPDEPQGNEHPRTAGSPAACQAWGDAGGAGDADPNPPRKAQLRPSSVTSTSRGVKGTLTQPMCDRMVPPNMDFRFPPPLPSPCSPKTLWVLSRAPAPVLCSPLLGCHRRPVDPPTSPLPPSPAPVSLPTTYSRCMGVLCPEGSVVPCSIMVALRPYGNCTLLMPFLCPQNRCLNHPSLRAKPRQDQKSPSDPSPSISAKTKSEPTLPTAQSLS